MSLLSRLPNAPDSMPGVLPVTSRYTFGLAGERFFRAIKDEGIFLGTHCAACEITYVPARQFCERCMHELDEWLDVGTQGEVHTFTLVYRNLDGTPRQEPEVVAFIRIRDGGIVHRLGETSLEQIQIGMPVKAVLKPKSKREGSILDIEYFKPAVG